MKAKSLNGNVIIKSAINIQMPLKNDFKKYRKYGWFQNFHDDRVEEIIKLKPQINTANLKF